VRALSDGAGHIYYAVITNPTDADQWVNWQLLADDAEIDGSDHSDVAVARGSCWFIYYTRAGHQIVAYTASDPLGSWSGPTAVGSASDYCFLAAAGNHVFCEGKQVRAWEYQGGSWIGPFSETTLTTTGNEGLAAAWDAAPGDDIVRLLIARKGELYHANYDPVAHTYTPPLKIYPGGEQEAPLISDIRNPSLAVPERGLVVATWIERHTEALSGWRYPLAYLSLDQDAEHYGCAVALAEPTVTEGRLALSYDSLAKQLYAGNNILCCRAPIYDPDIRGWMRVGPLEVSGYRLSQQPLSPARARLRIPDRSGTLRRLADAEGAAAIRPLSRVDLARGYLTSAGVEMVSLPPLYVLRATRSEGRGGGYLVLECTDAWGLLHRWRPQAVLQWFERPIRWLLAELCGRVGLLYADDGSPDLGRELAVYSLPPDVSGLSAVRELLRLGAAVARVREDGTLYAQSWPAKTGDVATVCQGELLRAELGCSAYDTTAIRVLGVEVYAEGENLADAHALGRRHLRTIQDRRIASVEMAEAVRDRELALAHHETRADRVVVSLRPELELWDGVDLQLAPELLDPETSERVLVGLVERYDAALGIYISELTLGAR